MTAAYEDEPSEESLSAGDPGDTAGGGQPPPATFEFLAHTLFTHQLRLMYMSEQPS